MRVRILKRFIADSGHLFAPGEREVDNATAKRLISRGKAVAIAVSPLVERLAAQNASDIPEDFPERERLMAAGITSVEQLSDPALDLSDIEGIGPAKRAKIEAAIAEL